MNAMLSLVKSIKINGYGNSTIKTKNRRKKYTVSWKRVKKNLTRFRQQSGVMVIQNPTELVEIGDQSKEVILRSPVLFLDRKPVYCSYIK